MSKQRITAPKGHRFIPVDLHYRDTFKLPKVHERLSKDRIAGLDSESFQNRDYGAEWHKGIGRYDGGLRTNLVPLDFADPSKNVMIETREYDGPIEAAFDHVFPVFADPETYPSRTMQRPKTKHTSGVNAGQTYRNGRRQWVEPVALIMFNLEYDLGRLFRNHPQFQRYVSVEMNSVRIQVGKYEVEIAQLTPSGNAASFEFYIRYDGKILRLIGRDAWAYIKTTLDEAAECFLGEHKEELDNTTFLRLWEDLTEGELARLKEYAAKDARLTRELYEMLIELLTSIDKHVICKNGLLPKSSAGAAAKMAFSMASREEWKRPSRYVMEMGAMAYAGGRVFNREPGLYNHINVFDVDSMYPFIMTQLPDPCTCEYIDIDAGSYSHDQWRGQFGVMLIDGEGLDPYYPALRDHDEKNQRLRYIYGPFTKVWSTIPEIVIGVESGRLRVDHIHGGIWLKGTNDDSFLRQFSLKMYGIKSSQVKGSPLYNLAKELVNSLAGKLAEVTLDRPYINLETGAIPFPDNSYTRAKVLYQQLHSTYIRHGHGAIIDIAEALTKQYPNTEETIPFQTIIDQHIPAVGKAGAYYLPMHASQITGLASARLGLAAHCTNAVSGHTDSLFVIGDQSEGLKQFHAIERAAGYESPETGMGAFRQEVMDGKGVLLKGNLYAIRTVDEETGEVHEKCATHGLTNIDDNKVGAYDMIMQLYENGEIYYDTKPSPRKLKLAAMQGKEPGVFESRVRHVMIWTDPNMTINSGGERVWKRYPNSSTNTIIHSRHNQDTIPPNIDERVAATNKVITWSQYQRMLSSKQDLNQDTIPPDIASSSLHDDTRKRSNSGLNSTRPSPPRVKSPRLNTSRLKNANTLLSTNGRNGSTRSYTNDELLEESACKNPQAGSSPST